MTKLNKDVLNFVRNPQKVKFKEIEAILLNLGFEKTPGKGSHVKYSHSRLRKKSILPIHSNDCKKSIKRKC